MSKEICVRGDKLLFLYINTYSADIFRPTYYTLNVLHIRYVDQRTIFEKASFQLDCSVMCNAIPLYSKFLFKLDSLPYVSVQFEEELAVRTYARGK